MKKVTILAAICMTLISFSGLAQGMGGGMGGGGGMSGGRGGMSGGQGGPGCQQGMQQQSRSLDIDFIGSTGYFEIDGEKAIKKMKIKKADKIEAVNTVLAEFTLSSQELIDSNRSDIDNLEFAKENLEGVEGDMTAMRELMKSVSESSRVIRPIMIQKHKELNEKMAAILSEKELARWEKFYKSECSDHSFNPDAQERSGGRPERGDGERPEGGEGRPPMM